MHVMFASHCVHAVSQESETVNAVRYICF